MSAIRSIRPPGAAILACGALLLAGLALAVALHWLHQPRGVPPESDLDAPPVFAWKERSRGPLLGGPEHGVSILCYHYFRPGVNLERIGRVLGAVLFNLPTVPDKDFWTTTVPEFDRQMRYLAESGYRTVWLDEVVDYVEGRNGLPARCVAITIDDGDRSLVEYAVPILRKYGFCATLFLITGLAGRENWNGLDLVDWPTLRRLEREGVLRVESHTHAMHTKARVGGRRVPRFLAECRDANGMVSLDSPLGRDLAASREAIRRELGRECQFLSWPFGFGEREVDSLATALGIRRTFTLWPERNAPEGPPRPGVPPEGLGRFTVTARTSLAEFRRMVDSSEPAEPPRGDALAWGLW